MEHASDIHRAFELEGAAISTLAGDLDSSLGEGMAETVTISERMKRPVQKATVTALRAG